MHALTPHRAAPAVDDNKPNRSVLAVVLRRCTAPAGGPITTVELEDGTEVMLSATPLRRSPR